MQKTLPLHLRINLRAKFASKGFRICVSDSTFAQPACDKFWRVFGYPFACWVSAPHKNSAWRAARFNIARGGE